MTALLPALTPLSLPPQPCFRVPHETLRTILPALPRGAITEILGPASSGRTALIHSLVAAATASGELAVVIDFENTFDPASAQIAGTDLGKLLWVRAGGRLDHAMRSADIVLHGGGFGIVVLDLCDVPQKLLQHVPTSYWYRFRRAVEHTPTILLVAAHQAQARSCAVRQLELRRQQVRWSGHGPFRLLEGMDLEAGMRKPPSARAAVLQAAA
jgi:recA bacterial DNA recombination protein